MSTRTGATVLETSLLQQLEEERACHAETQGYLDRALSLACHYRDRARGGGGRSGSGASGGGDDERVVELVLEALACLARVGELVVTGDPLPPRNDAAAALALAQRRIELLYERVAPQGGPIGGQGGTG